MSASKCFYSLYAWFIIVIIINKIISITIAISMIVIISIISLPLHQTANNQNTLHMASTMHCKLHDNTRISDLITQTIAL